MTFKGKRTLALMRNTLQWLIPKSIWAKLFVILVFCDMLPIILLGPLLLHTSSVAVKTSVKENYKEIALRASKEIDLFVQQPYDILKLTASTLAQLKGDAWRQETILVELVLRHPIFERVYLVDAAGHVIAKSGPEVFSSENAGNVKKKALV